MKIRSKLLLVLGVTLSAFVFTSPAAQAAPLEDRVQADFTFTRQGQQVTCTVVGTSSFELAFELEGKWYSGMNARTALSDTDPACSSAVRSATAALVWFRREGEIPLGAASTTAQDDHVELDLTVKGAPRVVRGDHGIVFECDESPVEGCDFRFATAPK
jgi:hypothetical protein